MRQALTPEQSIKLKALKKEYIKNSLLILIKCTVILWLMLLIVMAINLLYVKNNNFVFVTALISGIVYMFEFHAHNRELQKKMILKMREILKLK